MSQKNEEPQSPPLAERRPKPRKKVLLTGILCHSEGAYSAGCTIRNLSESGALIALPAGLSLPSSVCLINMKTSIAYTCKVEWYRGGQAGLSFAASYDLNSLNDQNLAYLQRLWRANRVGATQID